MRKYGLALLAAAVLLLAAATAACVNGGSGGGSSDPSSGETPAPESSTDGKTDTKGPDTSDIFSETESETYVTTPEALLCRKCMESLWIQSLTRKSPQPSAISWPAFLHRSLQR